MGASFLVTAANVSSVTHRSSDRSVSASAPVRFDWEGRPPGDGEVEGRVEDEWKAVEKL